MVNYEPVKTNINATGLIKVIISIVVKYYNLLESIISNKNSQNSGFYYATFLELSKSFWPYSTLKQITKLKSKTV